MFNKESHKLNFHEFTLRFIFIEVHKESSDAVSVKRDEDGYLHINSIGELIEHAVSISIEVFLLDELRYLYETKVSYNERLVIDDMISKLEMEYDRSSNEMEFGYRLIDLGFELD